MGIHGIRFSAVVGALDKSNVRKCCLGTGLGVRVVMEPVNDWVIKPNVYKSGFNTSAPKGSSGVQ